MSVYSIALLWLCAAGMEPDASAPKAAVAAGFGAENSFREKVCLFKPKSLKRWPHLHMLGELIAKWKGEL